MNAKDLQNDDFFIADCTYSALGKRINNDMVVISTNNGLGPFTTPVDSWIREIKKISHQEAILTFIQHTIKCPSTGNHFIVRKSISHDLVGAVYTSSAQQLICYFNGGWDKLEQLKEYAERKGIHFTFINQEQAALLLIDQSCKK
jgi:hypothetical protein